MNEKLSHKYELNSKDLRAYLKSWENDWARAHGGCKPGRQDIKNNPDIAEKYKEYNMVRDMLARKAPPPPFKDHNSTQKKRPSKPTHSDTPLKRPKCYETPLRARVEDDELMSSPAISRKLFSPAQVTSLGPTPQKDGRVLGLFDLIVERELGTLSKDGSFTETKPTGRRKDHATPSKRTPLNGRGSDSRLGLTPTSERKRQVFDVTTPLKNRGSMSMEKTPTSATKQQLDTPAFLKRHLLSTRNGDVTIDDLSPHKLPRKSFARSLSEIVASLRRAEEEKLDEDLEALREVESEQQGQVTAENSLTVSKDTNGLAQRLPLCAFDGEAPYKSPDENSLGRIDASMPIFKKKGPKRTTRLVNIRPIITRRPLDMNTSDGNYEADENKRSEMQLDFTERSIQEPRYHDFDKASEEDYRPTTTNENKAATTARKETTVKKAVRKANQLAHANFQRLKLRNSGARGGPGHNSRFRRRR